MLIARLDVAVSSPQATATKDMTISRARRKIKFPQLQENGEFFN
jgi:hypothetical protein